MQTGMTLSCAQYLGQTAVRPMLTFGRCGSVSTSVKIETSTKASKLCFLPSLGITALYHVTFIHR